MEDRENRIYCTGDQGIASCRLQVLAELGYEGEVSAKLLLHPSGANAEIDDNWDTPQRHEHYKQRIILRAPAEHHAAMQAVIR